MRTVGFFFVSALTLLGGCTGTPVAGTAPAQCAGFIELVQGERYCCERASTRVRDTRCTPLRAGVVATPASSAVPSASSAALPELRVGTSGDYAPFSLRAADGEVSGFDAQIAAEMAHDFGVRVSWVGFRWPELSERLAAGAFDVAMSGVTWQPARAVSGYMTRAVGRGGPCVLGDAKAQRVGVNRGGVLEAWAKKRLSDRELTVVDDNRSLPALLESGKVGAIVTDSFERRAFERPGVASHCEPLRASKVYWVTPGRAAELGPRIDAWLAAHGAQVQAAQQRWFGERQRLDAGTHLVDLVTRRIAFMPYVAEIKAQRQLPIEDLPREREVLEGVKQSAARLGLPEQAVLDLFALQIELGKAVQRRQREASSFDLGKQLRPAISGLGERILAALAEARASTPPLELELADLEPVAPWLDAEERQRLLATLRAALRAKASPQG